MSTTERLASPNAADPRAGERDGKPRALLIDPQPEREWLAAVLDSMTEEVYFTDTQRRYTYANPAALRQFGHTSVEGIEVAEIISRLEVLRPDGTPRPTNEAPPLRALQGEVIRDEEQIVRLPTTGQLRHRQVSSAPVRDSSGQIIGSVSVVRDVTEQKRSDAVLRARDTRISALLRLADEFRSLISPGDLIFSASRLLGETLGVTRCGYGTIDADSETVTVERDWHAPGVSDIEGILKYRDYGTYIDELKRGETVVCNDAATDPRTAHAVEAFEALKIRAFVNTPVMEQGRVVARLYVAHSEARVWLPDELVFIREVADRTRVAVERRRSEQALASDLKDTRLLRDLAGRLIGEGEPHVLFDEILAAAMRITNADAGTIQLLDEASKYLTFVAARGFSEAMTSHFARVDAESGSPCGIALARGERVILDFDVPASEDPDGSSALHLAYGLQTAQSTPLISRTGRPLGMFSTHWRARRRLDERELRFLDLLARQAADLIERTQAQESLRQREAELREADRRKDEFIAVLAHELRNPLVPIRAGAELLRRARERPDVIDSVRPIMERQIGHMVRLIDDLLDVSRITSGKFELQRQHATLSSLVGNAIDANREAISAGGLELEVNLADPHWVLNVDPTRFTQVISNLLQNATKFTPAGGRITVRAQMVQSASRNGAPELCLTVSDTGEGISASLLPRIFDLFAQGNDPGQGKHAGLGIGLALARRIVELHDGTIEARSGGLGQGAQIIIRMPAAQDLQSLEQAASDEGAALRDLSVLVIDDNRDGADAMALLLGARGATVNVAYDGSSGVERAAELVPQIILLDIGMPGMDGYQTCNAIRKKIGSKARIVALTGWGQVKDKELALARGFDAHLTKPADLETLEATVAKLMGR